MPEENKSSTEQLQKKSTFDKLVISPDQIGKRVFSFVMILLSLISTFTATYLACFGFPENNQVFFIVYYSIEFMFAIDIILCFFT
jgi:hypothetical protein